jgi:putative ABC transport system permease protein
LTAIFGLSIGIALLIIINAASMAYSEAARMPLKEIGANITVQRNGNVPEELKGPVFPCSAVTIRNQEVDRIRNLGGIQGFGQALLIWVFDPDRFSIILGIEPENPTGPGILRHYVIEGRFLEKSRPEALVEAAFARQFKIHAGDRVSVNGREYPVAGLVDASRASRIALANIYLPLSEARKMAEASRQVQKVSPFAPEDVNILFIKADQGEIGHVTAGIKEILGKRASVSTPESFLKLLGNLFALSDKFSLVTSLIAILVAVLIVFKTLAGNVAERADEIGVLKTVGWSNRNVVLQILGESVLQCFAGGVLGLAIAFLAAVGLGFLKVQIPIPWEMSPTPHFLPGGGDPIFKTLRLPVQIPWKLASFSLLLSMLIGALTGGFLGRHISRIKPSEVLRHE